VTPQQEENSMTSGPIQSLDFTSLRKAYAAGVLPEEVIADVYARIEISGDPSIFISLLPKARALELARALGPYDPSKPLYGIPIAIKDNIDFGELPTTAACPAFAYQPAGNAFVIDRLMAAGAIPIGKTNLDQFATGLVGVRSSYGVPRNSFDEAYVPGGSSSGSAVAVARGLVSFALGTDTAGSGRVPAALNNIVGLKPSLGAISSRGVVPACRSLDCVSIFALTVDDAFTAFAAASAQDAEDAYSRAVNAGTMGPVQPGLRLAIPDKASRQFGGDGLSAAAFDKAVELASSIGAKIVEIDLAPFFETARLLYEGPWVAERYHAVRSLIESSPDSLLPVTRQIIGGATRFAAVDAFDAFYKLAALRKKAAGVWSSIDAMLLPTYPRPRTVADLAADPVGPNSELGTYTNFVNLLDLCGLAVPGPFRSDGFPSGVTLLAPAGRDAFIASIGAVLHEAARLPMGATGIALPASAERVARANEDEVEIVVVGAHLSGMALNFELRDLNARFLRKVATTADYKLFALPGGPPFKPGLLRTADNAGSAIDVEVWAMTPEAFGLFVSRIPPPLGIGTVRLADGSAPKGFLAEPLGLEGAADISHFGGWRAYMSAKAS
jgi:allophanate hydrolase